MKLEGIEIATIIAIVLSAVCSLIVAALVVCITIQIGRTIETKGLKGVVEQVWQGKAGVRK